MRRGILGTIVAWMAGAGAAWGQAPAPISMPGGQLPPVMAGDVVPASGPQPILQPPLTVGPPADPFGLGPNASSGPPPSPMYPTPGPYTAPLFQPPPPGQFDGANNGYGSLPRFEFWGGYTLWFNKNQGTPYPLLTTSSPSQGGVVGQSSTLVLAGGSPINYGGISGLQFGADFWGDDDRRFGMLAQDFYTENVTISQKFAMTGNGPAGANSFGIPVLARPFIDTTTGQTTALVLSGPNIGPASAVVSTSSQTWGVSNSAIWNLYRSAPGEKWWVSTDLLVGYRFTELRESLAVSSVTEVESGLSPVTITNPLTGFPVTTGYTTVPNQVNVGGVTVTGPGQIGVVDRFTTTNLFNGTTVGFRNELRYGMFSLETTGQLGMGDMHQVLEITGYTYVENTSTANRPGQLGTAYGGLYANAANIGRYSHDDFAVLPELTANLGINLTQAIRAYVGFNFMYMNHVIRPGDQMNPYINSTSIPLSPNYGGMGTTSGTRMPFVQTDYWLLGVNFGFDCKY